MPILLENDNNTAAIQPSLILIPDISGFTRYMHDSDNIHCRYIIAELLEIILNSNQLGLSLSELEGDAVLFYKFGHPPSFKEIISQCYLTFTNFHKHIKQFMTDTLCDCGCCKSANDLSLKFIIHYGKVSPVNIKKHEKLFGRDVIIAHRLLKNNIKNAEYILLSEAYLSTQDKNELIKIISLEKIAKGKIEYEHLGTLNYFYKDISDLKNTIKIIEPSLPKDIGKSRIKFKIYIDTPPDFVLGIITNFKFKPNWITILQNIQFNEKTIPRIGGLHKCLMSDIFFKPIFIDYQSIYLNKEKTKYVEKLSSRLINLNAYLSYNIKSSGLGTLLQLELHFSQIGFYPAILRYFFERKLSKRRIRTSLNKLKYLCETIYNKYFSNSYSSTL
jgi:hypothetical protein